MGLGILRQFARFTRGNAKGSESTVDTGGGFNIRCEHFAAPGDDSSPLPGDYVALISGPGTGKMLAVGYADPDNDRATAAGEKRVYSRGATGGAVMAEVWLKNDGSVVVANDAGGSILLLADGTANINGATIDMSGNIVTTGTITAANVTAGGKSLAVHTHLAGTPPGTTGPNT